MRKIILILSVAIATIGGSVSCTTSSGDNESRDGGDMVDVVERGYTYKVWVDRETGCLYLETFRGGNGTAIVQLTDNEGNPKLYRK